MKRRDDAQLELTLTEVELNQLADRALILLSFKETDTQNLRFIMNLLGIRTLKEKLTILQEIFWLIRKGFVYVPEGLPQLIDFRSLLTVETLNEIENIDLCLLCPHERLIQEIQREIDKARHRNGG